MARAVGSFRQFMMPNGQRDWMRRAAWWVCLRLCEYVFFTDKTGNAGVQSSFGSAGGAKDRTLARCLMGHSWSWGRRHGRAMSETRCSIRPYSPLAHGKGRDGVNGWW